MTSSRRRRAEVDVDVRIGRPALVDEALEEQVVADRLDPADPEGVGDDRAGRAAATLGRDPLLPGEPHQVPADQEELGEPGPLDHIELVGEPFDDGRGQRVIALPGAGLAQLDEVGERRLALRHREPRKAVLLEPEVDRTGCRQLPGIGDALLPDGSDGRILARRQRRDLRLRLQVRLAIGTPQVRQLAERPPVADGRQHVLEFTALRPGIVDVVRHHDRQPEFAGEARRLRHQPVVVRQEVVRQLEIEPARKPARECRGGRPGTLAIPDQEPPGDLAISTARQRNESLDVLGKQLVAEARNGLGPGEVRSRDEPAQAPIAGRVASEEDEVRTTLALADAAVVLLDRAPDDRAVGPAPAAADPAGPRRHSTRLRRPSPTPSAAGRSAVPAGGRDDDPVRIRRRSRRAARSRPR